MKDMLINLLSIFVWVFQAPPLKIYIHYILYLFKCLFSGLQYISLVLCLCRLLYKDQLVTDV